MESSPTQINSANILPVEALILIFEYLYFRDLIACRGVTHRWASIINNGSLSLRKTLFTPKPTDKNHKIVNVIFKTTLEFRTTDASQDRRKNKRQSKSELWLDQDPGLTDRVVKDVFTVHPFITDIPGHIYHLKPHFDQYGIPSKTLSVDAKSRHRNPRRCKLNAIYPNAPAPKGWNDMCISMPPIKRFDIEMVISRREGFRWVHRKWTVKLENEEGVRLGQVIGVLRTELKMRAAEIDS